MCVIDYPCQGKNYVDTDLCQLHFGEAGSPSIFCLLWKFSSSFITCCPSLPPLALPLMNPRRNEALGRVFCIPHSWPCERCRRQSEMPDQSVRCATSSRNQWLLPAGTKEGNEEGGAGGAANGLQLVAPSLLLQREGIRGWSQAGR